MLVAVPSLTPFSFIWFWLVDLKIFAVDACFARVANIKLQSISPQDLWLFKEKGRKEEMLV